MNITLSRQPAHQIEADAVVVFISESQELDQEIAELDHAIGGALSSLVDSQEITGKTGELTRFAMLPGMNARYLLVQGLGKTEQVNSMTAFRSAAQAAKSLANKTYGRVA